MFTKLKGIILSWLSARIFKGFLKKILAGKTDFVVDWFFGLGVIVSKIGRKLARKAGSEKLWNNTIEPVLIIGIERFVKGLKSD